MGKFLRWLTATEEIEMDERSYSLSNPGVLAEYLGLSMPSLAGVSVTENSSLGLSAVYRAVSIISGTIAGLPLKSYRTVGDTRERVNSFLDNPGGPNGLTQFEWTELVLVNLLLHGNAYLAHIYNGGGAVVGLQPIHPMAVSVKWDPTHGKIFEIQQEDGSRRTLTQEDLTHITGMSTDGLVGLSPIQVAKQTVGTGIAGDQAAARQFGSGMMLGGLVTVDGETLTEEDAKTIMVGLKNKVQGVKNAGDLAFVNANVKISPWTMTNEDAEFIASRQFQVEEIARLYGVPKVLLAQDGASTWGSGIAELNRGLAKYTLMAYTSRIEQRLSRLLTRPVIAEYDYAGLLQSTPEVELDMLVKQLESGILTLDEVRRIRNLPSLPQREVESGETGAVSSDETA